uniref:EOG090X0FOW n=1 Tax=Lynceus sp. MCZ IZ 141354 TaxID=1930659 RepID=A0A9N6ZET5_9CRUS|nr:EOG090X0FOW [Lynceus sp. MCZ IZ 141354]
MNASENEYFTVGSSVKCTTCYNVDIEGEVMAFDSSTKMLIVKSPASCGRPMLNDIHVVNLNHVSDVTMLKETTQPPPPVINHNVDRLKRRVQLEVKRKCLLVEALKAGATAEGLSLYNIIHKTIGDISWNGADIVVMNKVTIKAPYTVNDVVGVQDCPAFGHIRKIVEKHQNEKIHSKTDNPSAK